MVLLENDTFLSELTRLFQKTRSQGSINLTMKRYDGRTKPRPRAGKAGNNPPDPTEHSCLIRAVVGNKKISTVIHQRDVNRFQLAYANLLKGNMDGLKKKAKAKTKSKATQ